MIICSNFNVDSEKYSLKACFYLMVESWQRHQLLRLLWSVELKSEALNYIIYTVISLVNWNYFFLGGQMILSEFLFFFFSSPFYISV